MEEDYFNRARNERALRAFNAWLPVFGHNTDPEIIPKIDSIDVIVDGLNKLLDIGHHLMLGSRHMILDGLTEIKRKDDALWILGNQDGDPEAHGYCIKPSALYVVKRHDKGVSCIILDNKPPAYTGIFQRKSEMSIFAADERRSYELIDLNRGHNPLIVFPHGSLYCYDDIRQKLVDGFCAPDWDDIPVHQP